MAYMETFILKLGAQYEPVTIAANFMGMISVKSKSSLTSIVSSLCMRLFTYSFFPSPSLFSNTSSVVISIYKNSLSNFANVSKNNMEENRQLISISIAVDSNKSLQQKCQYVGRAKSIGYLALGLMVVIMKH
jgi:hypothetical protein